MPHPINLLSEITRTIQRSFTPPELATLTAEHLNFDSKGFTPGLWGTTNDFYTNVVEALNQRDLLSDLIVAARAERPANGGLVSAAERLGLSPTDRVATADGQAGVRTSLEKAVRKNAQHIDLALLFQRIGECEARVCSIESGGESFGTGLLIGPDEVLTNFHVAEPIRDGELSAAGVRVRFDFRRDREGKIFGGRHVGLAAAWLAEYRPYASFDISPPGQPDPKSTELDYAVLRLQARIGEEPVTAAASERRGWYDLAEVAPPPARGEPVFLLGYPQNEPQALSMGKILDHVGQGRRMRHDAWSIPGSSGSPILDANGRLCGLHHGTEPRSGTQALYNQGIPITLIAADLAAARAGTVPASRSASTKPKTDGINKALESAFEQAALPSLARPPGLLNRGLRAGLSSKIGSVHLHIDGGHEKEIARKVMTYLDPTNAMSELVYVETFALGRQREEMPDLYRTHTPIKDGLEALEYFTTTVLHELGELDELRVASIEDKIAQALGQLSVEMAGQEQQPGGVVIEAEIPVGLVTDDGTTLWNEPALDKSLFSGKFPFVTRNSEQSVYETHIGIDLPRDGGRSPIEFADLAEITDEIGISLGGWFRFSDPQRWAYRSNMFSTVADEQEARQLHSFFKSAMADRGYDRASVKVLVEKSLGIWSSPFRKRNPEALSLPELIAWERSIPANSTFFVVSGNFLGDLHQSLTDAMRDNALRGVSYSYFLRSFADLVRWLSFRDDFLDRYGLKPQDVSFNAYVFEFASPSIWEDLLDCFVAKLPDGTMKGYRVDRHPLTRNVIMANPMKTDHLKRVDNLLQRFVDSETIVSGRRVSDAKEFDAALIWLEFGNIGEEQAAGVLTFDHESLTRLDQDFATIISQFDGEAIISNESRYLVILPKDRIKAKSRAEQKMGERQQTVYRAFLLAAELCKILAKRMAVSGRHLPYRLILGYDTLMPVYRSSGTSLAGAIVQACRQHARVLPEGLYVARNIIEFSDTLEAIAEIEESSVKPDGKTRLYPFRWTGAGRSL